MPVRLFPSLPLSLCLAALSAGPLAAQDTPREITGTLSYLARIALPPDAEAEVVARGAFGTVLGEARIATEGRQVPLPFALGIVPGLSGTLDALIRVDGAPRWLIEGVPVPQGGDAADLGDLVLQPFRALAFATEFDCGGTRISVGLLDDRLTMRTGVQAGGQAGGQDYPLVPVPAASGAKYVAEGDESTGIWEKGDAAMVTIGGTTLPECVRANAVAETPYRARGNEPGWAVTVGAETVEITADYGETVRSAARPEAQAVPGGYVLEMPEIAARLTLTEEICRDDATGMPYPHRAELALDGRSFAGCGGDPARLLIGTWRIEDIAGTGIIDGSDLSIAFGADGRVSGSAGCNRMIGGYALSGEGLSFTQMGTTMMACPEALMVQERRVLDALADVSRFDIDATGALLLIGGAEDGALLTARRD